MEMTYREQNGVQIPNLTLPTEEKLTLGKYALMRLKYLKEHRRGTYGQLLGEAKLERHLYEIEQTAKAQIEETVNRMALSQGVNEQMKQESPMKWVQMMNSFKTSAEETVIAELICA